ncbi:mitochondrial import receptor subunit Tom6p [[Candida] anglica]|uniref:Mitochondrial import receptor subunit Tom6p n=1 Tax=[Candida] anglica TaxID=148631 RepID=A0ABP0EI80_9ASCO
MSGRIPVEQESYLSQIQKTPAYTLAVHAGLFVAGIAFIQSPLMEMLVPQL